jgi:phosphoglycerate dehydrogenase-like enzyme
MPETPIVVVSPLPEQLADVGALLAAAGCDVRRLPDEPQFAWNERTLAEHVAEADALVGIFARAPITAAVLDAAPRVRVVTSPIIGTDTIDVDACTARGIVVANGATPENYLGMAEAVVMLIAALRKQLLPKIEAVAAGGWRPPDGVGRLVLSSVVGLVGYGAIGRATAARLAGWECRVLVHDPYVERAAVAASGAEAVELDELLATADVVSLAVTLSNETRNLIGRRELALMKRGAFLINTARGGLVDEAALRDTLDAGHLAGAAIDTWVDEGPGSASPLRGHPRVIATGHNVGHSAEAYASHPPAARDNTLRALRGEPPSYVKNPAVLAAWAERVALLQRLRPLRAL